MFQYFIYNYFIIISIIIFISSNSNSINISISIIFRKKVIFFWALYFLFKKINSI